MSEIPSIFTPELNEPIYKLYSGIGKKDEFECMIYGRNGRFITQEKYIKLIKYFGAKAKKNNTMILVQPNDTLDIIYDIGDREVIRCTIDGIDSINFYMRKLALWNRQPHVIFSAMIKFFENSNNKNISFLKKQKKNADIVDVDDYNLRFRLAQEDQMTADMLAPYRNLDETNINKIIYRMKQRTSLYMLGNDVAAEFVRADLTQTKMSNMYDRLNNSVSNFELEVEYGCTSGKPTKKTYDFMMNEIEKFLKYIQQSNYIISNTTSSNVIDYYSYQLSIQGADRKITTLEARNPVNLEVQYLTENLTNRYAVTDKADGDRCFLIVYEETVYLITNNMIVMNLGLKIEDKKYNGTIMDGEYIFLNKYNRHVFLVFDCLFRGSEDIRSNPTLMERLTVGEGIINNCFLFGKQEGYKIGKQNNSKTLDEYIEYYTQDITKYMKAFNNDLLIEQHKPLIRRKYFIPVVGLKDWEIFAYASLMYSLYTINDKIRCPYLIDGLMFHPLEQAYVSNKESKKIEYKWKPPEKNSIDFYIEFVRDRKTGNIMPIYDNSGDIEIKNKPYYICHLYVGQKTNNGEKPVLFFGGDDRELYVAHIYLKNGEARDLEGNILSDKTVVEFSYDMTTPGISDKFRWVPMKTRHDKTEAVNKYGVRYGNYYNVAEKVWRSIITPVLLSDLEDLAKGNNPDKNEYLYETKMNNLKKKISHSLIVVSAKENNVYYQQREKMIKPMAYFHNWVKSNLIYTYCNRGYSNDVGKSVLDMACGKGGDIPKFSYSKVSFVVGFDYDLNGIESPVDGCISRYENMKRKRGFPNMYFFQANAGAILSVEDQDRSIQGLKPEYKTLIEKFFPKNENKRTKFDCVNCQFAVHYLLKDNDVWSNYKSNINMSLKNGGYYLATCFDAEKVLKLLDGKDKYTEYYVNNKGDKTILFEIVKKFDNNLINQKHNMFGTGHAIDVYISWINEAYLTEYLVDKRFFIYDLGKDCDLDLVDTDSFENVLKMNKNFFSNYAKYESVEQTQTYLKSSVGSFYEETDINKSCYVWNSLMRYYVFRKKEFGQKGGSTLQYDFMDQTQFSVANMSNPSDNYNDSLSFMNSIHKLLQSHKVIPKTLSMAEFYENMHIKYILDNKLELYDMADICNKIIITHETVKDIKKVMNNINIFVIENDCNGYDIEFVGSEKTELCMLLIKNNNKYVPIFHNEPDGKFKGLFKMTDDIITHIKEFAN
jgi:hypothetical protein